MVVRHNLRSGPIQDLDQADYCIVMTPAEYAHARKTLAALQQLTEDLCLTELEHHIDQIIDAYRLAK